MGTGRNEKVVKRMNQSLSVSNFPEKKISNEIAKLENQPYWHTTGGFVKSSINHETHDFFVPQNTQDRCSCSLSPLPGAKNHAITSGEINKPQTSGHLRDTF